MDCASAFASRRDATTVAATTSLGLEKNISPRTNPLQPNHLQPNPRRGQKLLLQSATEHYTTDHHLRFAAREAFPPSRANG
jgi:hypothetical protein